MIENKINFYLKERLNKLKLLEKYKYNFENSNENLLNKELIKIENILLKIYSSYETGLYNEEMFLKRKNHYESIIRNLKEKIEKEKNPNHKRVFIPILSNFIFNNNLNCENRNRLYLKIIKKIIYTKEKGGKGFENNFKLQIYLNV